MYRDRIRRIGVHDDQVVDVVGLLRKGEPRVADHRLHVGIAIGDVSEIFRVARGIDHGLVDLEELPGLAGLGGTSERTGAEADHSDPQRRRLPLTDRRNYLTDTAILVVIGDRLWLALDRRAVVVVEFLRAVNGRAVQEHV